MGRGLFQSKIRDGYRRGGRRLKKVQTPMVRTKIAFPFLDELQSAVSGSVCIPFNKIVAALTAEKL
jgi:hypothetical protein